MLNRSELEDYESGDAHSPKVVASPSWTRPSAYFSGKDAKGRKGKDIDDAVLDYDLMYPSTNGSSTMNNPRESQKNRRRPLNRADEEIEYKEGNSDVVYERDRRRQTKATNDNMNPNPHRRFSKIDEMMSNPPISSRAYPGSQDCTSVAEGFPNVLTAYKHGTDNDFIQCVIVRDRNGFQAKIFPNYELRLQETNKVLIIAKKMNLNRTSNYHMFDMTKGQPGSVLTKKSSNYLGKLRAKNAQRTEYILMNHSAERQEVAGFMFDRVDSFLDTKDGIKPRKLSVILPRMSSKGLSIPNRVIGDDETSSITEALKDPSCSENQGMHMFETKEPSFINGNFRLNFHGRVSVPSVKNFQLISVDDVDNIVCQFGKVDDDRFHMDYKTPFNALQAFALALSQFNL